jgi:hypothetical protein
MGRYTHIFYPNVHKRARCVARLQILCLHTSAVSTVLKEFKWRTMS